MCFSASASFIAGSALGSAGAYTLKKAKTSARRPIAAIPLLFGIQQLIEGVVWISLADPRIHAASTMAFLLMAHVLWPTYLPYAVWRDETGPRRKKALMAFVLFGAAVSLYLLYYLLRGEVTAALLGGGVAYTVPLPNLAVIPAAYVLVTCGSCFLSSHKFIRVFGLALVASLAIAWWYYNHAFASVWCFFAAILSLVILVHVRQKPLA
jgi:hypothetical protein